MSQETPTRPKAAHCCEACGRPFPSAVETTLHRADINPTTVLGRALQHLARSAGEYVSYESVFNAVYGDDPNGGPLSGLGCLKVHISKHRAVLATVGLKVECRWGFGWRLVFDENAPPEERTGTKKTIPNEEEVLTRAAKLKATGISWRRVADILDAGVGAEWLKWRLVPGHAEKRLASESAQRKQLREKPSRTPQSVPPDTRDVTGAIFGDPLPGRSALDKRRAGAIG